MRSNRQPPAALDRKTSLDGILVLNDRVSSENDRTGRLVITVRLQRSRGLLARFQPPVLERHVRLDEIGSFVFKLINNQRSAFEIIELFLEQYRVNRREATLSVVSFLKSLVERRIVSIVIR